MCGSCRKHPPPVDRLLSAWAYAPPLDAVLTGFKFRRLDYLGEDLGRELARRFAEELEDCDAVAAVPLHWLRRLGRGYDQAEILARALAHELGRPRLRPLRRARVTTPQSRLPRAARHLNLENAFTAHGDGLRGLHWVIVDDVTTTGATLRAAAACLKKAGARRVTGLTVARTPEE